MRKAVRPCKDTYKTYKRLGNNLSQPFLVYFISLVRFIRQIF